MNDINKKIAAYLRGAGPVPTAAEAVEWAEHLDPPPPLQPRHEFHHLWTQTVGAARYRKSDWLVLDRLVNAERDPKRLEQLVREAQGLSIEQGAPGKRLERSTVP